MTASIIDGKAHAAALKARLIEATARLRAEHGLVPGLATVLVGDDPASEVYVRNKNKTAEALGFKSVHHHLAATASEAEVLALVARLGAASLPRLAQPFDGQPGRIVIPALIQ